MSIKLMNIRNIIIIFFCCLIIFGCKKNKPPVGYYNGTFIGSYTDTTGKTVSITRYERFEIIEVDKNEIVIYGGYQSESVLNKTNKKGIEGVLEIYSATGEDIGYLSYFITINGKWNKEKGKYYITGDFSYPYKIVDSINQTEQNFTVSGAFTIESDF